MTVAALFVDPKGCYAGLPDVEVWDESRDARLYAGPHPVVAHPPCGRWCVPLAFVNETRYGHRVGDDGGCFSSALASVRRFGGVLEHPANSRAWKVFDLPRPAREGWQRGLCGGWSTHVEQGQYGHPARKATWLYAVVAVGPPALRWGRAEATAIVSWLPNTESTLPRLSRSAAEATPVEFRDVLLAIARAAGEARVEEMGE